MGLLITILPRNPILIIQAPILHQLVATSGDGEDFCLVNVAGYVASDRLDCGPEWVTAWGVANRSRMEAGWAG